MTAAPDPIQAASQQAPPPAPPTHLEIQVLDAGGALAGRKLVLDTSPVRFGRDPRNTLVLEDPLVSRNHGEITLDPATGQWSVVCYSDKGLKANKKPVTNLPTPLATNSATTLTAAGLKLMTVTPIVQTVYDEAGQPIDYGHATAPATGSNKRVAIWAGLGVWFLVLGGLAAFFLFTEPSSQNTDRLATWPDEQVATAIFSNPEPQTPNPTLVQRELAQANAEFERIDMQPDALRKAYEHYTRALTHDPDGLFDHGLDQRRYHQTQQNYHEQVQTLYRQATNQIGSQNYPAALQTLEDLNALYPSSYKTDFSRHLTQLRASVRSEIEDD